MVQKGAVTIVYDGDGNRVAETVGGVTTKYLVDTQNPTGYAQVVDELQNGAVTKTYSYGLERISQNWQPTTGNWQRAFYGYDGHGSVRFLTSSAGAVTDTYDYDAFGNLTNQTGTTPNNYLFAGEQFDPALNLYYNRARYLNTSTGRFWSMDTQEAVPSDAMSVHRYLYADGNPADNTDPLGLYTQRFGYDVEDAVDEAYKADFGYDPQKVTFGGWARVGTKSRSAPYSLKPDILDRRNFRGDGSPGNIWMEIKPLSISGIARAAATRALYSSALVGFSPDMNWLAGGQMFTVQGSPTLVFNVAGILFYTTNQQDYDRFQEAVQTIAGLGGAVAVGAGAAQLSNVIAKLPQVSSAGSEVIDISTKARIAIQGSEAEVGVEEGAAELETAVGF